MPSRGPQRIAPVPANGTQHALRTITMPHHSSGLLEPRTTGKTFPAEIRKSLQPIVPTPTVLLVDNDSAVRESLSRVLVAERLRVVTAAGAKEALGCMQEYLPDLVITDLLMVPLTGWDLMLHVQGRYSGLPIFVITALPPKASGGADRMANHFFQKPVDIDALIAAIHRHFDASDPEKTESKH